MSEIASPAADVVLGHLDRVRPLTWTGLEWPALERGGAERAADAQRRAGLIAAVRSGLGDLGWMLPPDGDGLWLHAVAVGCAAERLAARASSLHLGLDAAFLAGLLHDVGKLALRAVYPKAFGRAVARADQARGDIADFEREVLGVDHTGAGLRIAQRWRLPDYIQQAAWLHHVSDAALPPQVVQPRLLAVVRLADTLVREQGIGYSGNHRFSEPSPLLAARLGISEEVLAGVQHELLDAVRTSNLVARADAAQDGVIAAARLPDVLPDVERFEVGRDAEPRSGEPLAGEAAVADESAGRYLRGLALFEQQLDELADHAGLARALAGAAHAALACSHVAALLRCDHGAVACGACGTESGEARSASVRPAAELVHWLEAGTDSDRHVIGPAPAALSSLCCDTLGKQFAQARWALRIGRGRHVLGCLLLDATDTDVARLARERAALEQFLAAVGSAIARAAALGSTRRLAEDLADANRRLQQTHSDVLRSRTLSMIAEMAAGAGHELNSPLTVISGRAQMLAQHLADPEARRVLRMICDKAHECSGIVSELMDFARPRPVRLTVVDLPALLTAIREEWLGQAGLAPSRLRLEFPGCRGEKSKASAPALEALADPHLLRTVIRELLGNAADAIGDDGGVITLGARHSLEQDAVELTVADTGCGMSPSVLHRAFDPFYSHRKAGRRRGLGLPRAFRIVEAHSGRIWLESREGEGTTAHVLLPRPAAAPTPDV